MKGCTCVVRTGLFVINARSRQVVILVVAGCCMCFKCVFFSSPQSSTLHCVHKQYAKIKYFLIII